MSGKPIEPKQRERYAELVGLGLTGKEAAAAAAAVGISERSGDVILSRPECSKIADEARRGRGMQGDVAQVVRDMLTAVHPTMGQTSRYGRRASGRT